MIIILDQETISFLGQLDVRASHLFILKMAEQLLLPDIQLNTFHSINY
jgi:hypothetical protein